MSPTLLVRRFIDAVLEADCDGAGRVPAHYLTDCLSGASPCHDAETIEVEPRQAVHPEGVIHRAGDTPCVAGDSRFTIRLPARFDAAYKGACSGYAAAVMISFPAENDPSPAPRSSRS